MHRPAVAATSSAAVSRPRRLPGRSGRPSWLGMRAGQVMAWQLIIVLAIVALTERGPARAALGGAALLGCCLTVPRWRHRWLYQWLLTAWGFRRSGRPPPAHPAGAPGPCAELLVIDVTPSRARSGTEAGVVHDGDGFAVIIAAAPEPSGPATAGAPPTGALPVALPAAALAGLLDPEDMMISAVQTVMHADLAASDEASGPAAAYRSLGYHRVPRSQSTWLVLRHDPAVTRYAVASSGPARNVHTALLRAMAARGPRALDLLGDLGVHGRLLDAKAAGELLAPTLLEPGPAASPPGRPGAAAPGRRPGRPHEWRSWHSGTRRHVTYWLRRWPAAGMDALQQALATVPALSVTTAVVTARTADGRAALTATVRVTTGPGARSRAVARAVTAAAASCGARLAKMDGEHAAGVLATLPLGRPPAGRWLGWHADGPAEGSLATVLPVAVGGVVLGAEVSGGVPGASRGDSLVAVPFFTMAGPTRVTVIGDVLLPRLIALRALGTGARVQVVTSQPDGWLKLRQHAQVPPERMVIARPGTEPPPGASQADPWMCVDDTGSPAHPGSQPWQAVVTVLRQAFEPAALLPDQDAILLQRVSPAGAAAVVAAAGLDGLAQQPLESLPDGVVAVALAGAQPRCAGLAPDPIERTMLAGSMQPAEPIAE